MTKAPPDANHGNEQSKKRRREEELEQKRAKRARPPAPALVVFGLGNAEATHAGQRHNVGESVLRQLKKSTTAAAGAADVEQAAAAEAACPDAVGVQRLAGGSRPHLLLPPQGHINASGAALRAALKGLGVEDASVLVVVDDIALPLGVLRMKAKGSSGGHNGLKDIEREYGQEYHRLKLGIGGSRSKAHVVGDFTPEEQQLLQAVVARAAEAVQVWFKLGPEEIEQVLAKVNAPAFCKVVAPPDNPKVES